MTPIDPRVLECTYQSLKTNEQFNSPKHVWIKAKGVSDRCVNTLLTLLPHTTDVAHPVP